MVMQSKYQWLSLMLQHIAMQMLGHRLFNPAVGLSAYNQPDWPFILRCLGYYVLLVLDTSVAQLLES